MIAQHQDMLVAQAFQHAGFFVREQGYPLERVVTDAPGELCPIEIVMPEAGPLQCDRRDWRGMGVDDAVGVGPGAVATPINLTTMTDPVLLQKLNSAIPLGRMARPEEIASLVAFLAGDGASYMTATTIFADGGIMQSSPGL